MRVLGLPVKISSQKSIYFPINYLHVYGIDIFYDYLIRQEFDDYFIFLPHSKRPLLQNEIVVLLRAGNTYLPEHWIVNNHLTPGKDSLYLVGVDDGLLVSVQRKIKL